jgi:5S rRNA maturation endonuclease (ribonuclease M5)
MEFFNKFFKHMVEMDTGEAAVLCPFPHKDEAGNQYFESVPSAHINLKRGLFHCKVCGEGMSEAAFLSKIQGVSYKDALILLKEMSKHHGEWSQEKKNFWESEGARQLASSLGIIEVAESLQLGYEGEGISFPVLVYNELLDVRNYSPGRSPKVKSRRGAKNLLLPFDLWRTDTRPTLLCAGEKDMAIARKMGFNGLTFTGGEQAFPRLFKSSFKNKKIYILYDNDQAGKEGSLKIASLLKDAGAEPYVVTGHYETCVNKGEDLHDFFMKYHKRPDELQAILDLTEPFTEEEHRKEQQKYIPLVTIEEATKGQFANRMVSTRVSVVATYEEVFQVPEIVEFEKYDATDKCSLSVGTTKEWVLDEENVADILQLMDSGLKESQVRGHLKSLAHIPPKEQFVRTTIKSRTNIFKAVVTDDLESEVVDGDDEGKTMRELLVYSLEEPIKAGQKYRIFYKPTAHPLKGQQIVGIVIKTEESDNSINRFTVNESVKESLECFKVKEGETLEEKMNELYERAKGFVGVEARKDVTFATDLYYHTPLQFNFGRRTERAYLDVMIIGDPRTGKSQTAKEMLKMYELGIITSLKTATKAGLLGGSDQTTGGWKTKLGIIPRNHRGALIMEEFSGGGQELISQLTEVRSSNRVRLTRVNGSIDVPAQVRMLSISNPSTQGSGNSLPLRNYPNGIKVLLDLIGASEDIARYDFFLLVDEPDEYTSPLLDFEEEPFPKESYQNRVRWAWSRKPEQILMSKEVMHYIVKLAEDLNKQYNSHIKLFGPESWKKLARISIATAALVCSMDETGENLIVNKEHVDWANKYLISCYDNDLFKLKEYVENQKRFNVCDDETVHALEGMYRTHSIMLQQLEMSTDMNQRQLQMVSGLDQKEFAKVLNQMSRYGFFEYQGDKIIPTQRFRTAMGRINRNTYMPRLGEME